MFSLGIYLQMIDCNWFDKIKKKMVGIISHHNCMYGYNLSLFCD